MATRKFVRYSISVTLDTEDPLDDWADSEEEARKIIEEDAQDIIMDGWATWDVDVWFVEREVDEEDD